MAETQTLALAELAAKARKVTPRRLTGDKLKLWNTFIKNYIAGEYGGVSIATMFLWAKKHCELNCSQNCFRLELQAAKEAYAKTA